jgi:predicted CoA-substrate-specific enzyme activase
MGTIGFDFGSVYTKAVLLDGDGHTVHSLCFLGEIGRRYPHERFEAAVTGIDSSFLADGALAPVNDIIAIAAGIRHLGVAAQSVIEVGGHTAKFIVFDPVEPGSILMFSTNDACAAGTGSFLEQQARRLQLNVEELSELSTRASRHATIAGRCSVFAKSDMIHLQQKGTPVDEIAFGLCMAICRNSLATLIKGRDLETPVVIAGGCANNRGILRAFRETLGITDPALLGPSPSPGLEGAIGAAAGARGADVREYSIKELRYIASAMIGAGTTVSRALAPLVPPQKQSRHTEPEDVFTHPVEGYLGVDVGSVSTDFVVMDARGEILSAIYLPTNGRPVDAVRKGLGLLRDRFAAGLDVLGCATTGSGRHLAGRLLAADVTKNEITCQMIGARRFVNDVDTIIEIGGQDSKFISVRNGQIADFVMNKICAAGTGSFIEEQTRDMGIDVFNEFASRAFESKAPIDLGSRCTVFMETEVVSAMQSGIPLEDISAGLAYSIVKNYLDKVVGQRPLGRRVVFQGGVASNDAVVAAFAEVLKQPIVVHPFNRISGAVGAAIAAQNAVTGVTESRFRGLDPGPPPELRTFECKRCSNRCEVNLINMEGERVFFGDTCERYTSRASAPEKDIGVPNLADEYVTESERFFCPSDAGGLRVGIPRASCFMAHLPFWGTFFRELGCAPILSAATSSDTLTLGLKHLPVGACLPIKLTAGHASALTEQEVDYVFIPSVMHLPGEDPEQSYTCPYTMAAPFMIRMDDSERVLSPVISLTDEETFADGFDTCRKVFGLSKGKVRTAYRRAVQTQESFGIAREKRAQELIADGGYRYVFAVIGKPYNIFDAYVNLNLFERLRRLGVLAVPLDSLPVDAPESRSKLPWGFSADVYRATVAAVSRDGIYPVIVSNFGCGPDAFAFRHIEQTLRRKPHLMLEFDEHRGEVGLITRIEAFIDQLDGGRGQETPAQKHKRPATPTQPIPDPTSEVCIPYFADHVFAFSGLWKSMGYPVRVLPIPDQTVCTLGERYALGKECHAYSIILGDLLQLHRTSGGRELVYYLPGSSNPCLIHQYGHSIRVLMRKLDIDNIRLCTPTTNDLLRAFGIDAMERFYLGLLAIELLVKAACETRPYEIEKGVTAALHKENLLRIENAMADGDVLRALDESLDVLSGVAVERNGGRPIVGIAGDVYTKVNQTANNNLYEWLEGQGLEVWPSPFQIDLVDFGIVRRFVQSVSKLELPNALVHGTVALRRAIEAWRVRHVVGRRVQNGREPGYLELKRLAGPYMSNEDNDLLFVNIAKVVDFLQRGADGVINAICFNCMVGNASTAIIEKIRRDYHDVPIITAVYSGGEDPSRRMELEAFVSQVKEHRRRRSEQTSRPRYGVIGNLVTRVDRRR